MARADAHCRRDQASTRVTIQGPSKRLMHKMMMYVEPTQRRVCEAFKITATAVDNTLVTPERPPLKHLLK